MDFFFNRSTVNDSNAAEQLHRHHQQMYQATQPQPQPQQNHVASFSSSVMLTENESLLRRFEQQQQLLRNQQQQQQQSQQQQPQKSSPTPSSFVWNLARQNQKYDRKTTSNNNNNRSYDKAGHDDAVYDLPQRFAALSASLTDSSTKVPASQSDKLVSQAISNLTAKDREAYTLEQHGITTVLEDTPEFDETRVMKEFYQQVEHLKIHSRLPVEALCSAEVQNHDYVHNRDMYMKFLRTDNFDTKKAAVRFIKFWDVKEHLFGKSKLCQEICFSTDLHDYEIKKARKGYAQFLPSRDRAGRPITVSFEGSHRFDPPESLARILFAQEARDIESSKKGIVGIIAYMGDFTFDKALMDELFVLVRCLESFPYKVACCHILVDSSQDKFGETMDFFLGLLGAEMRAKVKIHRGTYTEQMYSLMTYGIPINQFPMTQNGKIKTKSHHEFLELIEARNRLHRQGFFDTVDIPSNVDILCGKGKPLHSHIGNVRLHNLVEELMDEYEKGGKNEKGKLAVSVVRQVKASSGRFLSRDLGVWTEVDDDVAITKVSQLFRARREALKVRNKNRATIENSSPRMVPTVKSPSPIQDEEERVAKRGRTD